MSQLVKCLEWSQCSVGFHLSPPFYQTSWAGVDSVLLSLNRCALKQASQQWCVFCYRSSLLTVGGQGSPPAVGSKHFSSLPAFNSHCVFVELLLLCAPVISLLELICVKWEAASCCLCSWKLQVLGEGWESDKATITYQYQIPRYVTIASFDYQPSPKPVASFLPGRMSWGAGH